MKGYVVSSTKNGKDDIDGIYYLFTEQGEVLASHLCSKIGFAIGDLYTGREERIKEFTERFGTFEVDYLGNDEMTMAELLKRNKEFYTHYIKACYKGSKRQYTFKTMDEVKAGDTVETAEGKHLFVVTDTVDMKWVETYGEDKIAEVKKVEVDSNVKTESV